MNSKYASPVASYRVQLTGKFTLHDAVEILPYLAWLGVDHLYTSPCLQAVPGSMSGYDVVDPGCVNVELGGAEGFSALSKALRQYELRHLMDIVPNHMAIGSGDNPWWYSVLQHGKSSTHADWFDVDWDASEAHWPNRVLLPVLGDQFGRVLEAGELQLRHFEGRFQLHYQENIFPVDPSSTASIFACVARALRHQQLAFYAECLDALPRQGVSAGTSLERRRRSMAVLADLVARLCREDPAVGGALDAEIERLNRNVAGLGELIEKQHYRLADWRAADLDLGYRRFFNINTLVGIRVELPQVFAAIHELPLRWLNEGAVHALRVDHPDGLRDPAGYMRRLREAAPDSWIVVEKILEPGEQLPAHWPVDGTTGYDFGHLVQGLFNDPAGEETLTRCYDEFIGQATRYEEVLRESRQCVLKHLLGSEVERLASLLRNICEQHWRHRDFTRDVFKRAIIEIAVCFKVYRTYVRPGSAVSAEDRARIEQAVAAGEGNDSTLDPELLRFIQNLLLLEVKGELEEEFALRFQQLTGPAMAKGIEDTALYRYLRLSALNEVGGDPGSWGTPVDTFHQWCVEAQRSRPLSLLATSTHDSKRSEDVRARLMVLSEVADLWSETVRRWQTLNAGCRGTRVDANAEYHFYQTLAGAWPVDEERMQQFMQKAVREAKVHTRWTPVDEEYEEQMKAFITAAMSNRIFMGEAADLVAVLQTSGWINSLAQTLLKLTAPGVPDIYQGCELWCLNLVDPDNRRPVDYALRQRLGAELAGLQAEAVMQRIDEGLPKLWLIRATLALRRKHAEWFGAQSSYQAVHAEGRYREHVLAFLRGGNSMTVVPRLLAKLEGASGSWRRDWRDTSIMLSPGTWRSLFEPSHTFTGHTELNGIFRTVPVALLVKESGYA